MTDQNFNKFYSEAPKKDKVPRYKNVEDLPEEAQEYFRPAPGGGFVLSSVRLLKDVKHALWSGTGKSDKPLGDDLMVTDKEFTDRARTLLREKMKSGPLSQRLQAFATLFKNDYNFEPSEIGAQTIEQILDEVTLEAATLTNEGLTKYENLNFKLGKSTDLKFKHLGHEFPLDPINPFSISGTLKVDGKTHKLEIIYATRGYQNKSYGNRRMDKGEPELFAVYYDDKSLPIDYDHSMGKLLAGKIFPAIIMRAENMPNTNDKLFAESSDQRLEDIVAQINESIDGKAKEKVRREEEREQRSKPTALDGLEKFVGINN